MKLKSTIQIIIFTVLAINFTIAQDNDPHATVLLDKAKQKIDKLSSYEFDFNLTIHRENNDIIQKGLFTSKGEKFHIATDEVQIMSDGKYSYSFRNNKKDIEIYDIDKDSKELDLLKGPASILGFYQTETFVYQLMSDQSKTSNLIVFKPVDKDGGIVKIIITLSKLNDLESCQIFMRDASNYLLKINRFDLAPNVDQSLFIFDKALYPDANIEDLRLD